MLRSQCARSLLATLALLVPAASCWAQWQLDSEKSAVSFLSIKNDSIAERHDFGSLAGYIGRQGRARLVIDLDSVRTMIEVRDQRLRELLFETAEFPSATARATIDPAVIAEAAGGGMVSTELSLTLALHGMDRELTVPVVLVGEGEGRLRVLTPEPVIIRAADFGLDNGIEALRKVAGLESIASAVPVTVQLVFTAAD